MSILIKDVLLNSKKTDIYIEGNTIKEIGKKLEADITIDGKNKAIIPGLINTHTHAAMTLMKGYADDMALMDWLQNKIWPLEAKLTEKDVYVGTKLACLEMIKTGTTCFNDMYWHALGTAKAAEEMGVRAAVSAVFIDMFDKQKAEEQIKLNEKLVKDLKGFSNRIIPALGPHAVYTVSKESLEWTRDFAKGNNLLIHFHLAETEFENADFEKKTGKKPVKFLEEINFLNPNLVACHSVHYTNDEIKILAKNNVKIATNPVSNMKLAVGGAINYEEMIKNNLVVSLGTDGCSSNNNLDMFESMKFLALLQKFSKNNQTIMSDDETFRIATSGGAKALGINAGEIKEGKLADVVLIDLKKHELTPGFNLISDLVYSANGSCVDTTIVDGKILMQSRKVEGEEKILEEARKTAEELVNR